MSGLDERFKGVFLCIPFFFGSLSKDSDFSFVLDGFFSEGCIPYFREDFQLPFGISGSFQKASPSLQFFFHSVDGVGYDIFCVLL